MRFTKAKYLTEKSATGHLGKGDIYSINLGKPVTSVEFHELQILMLQMPILTYNIT